MKRGSRGLLAQLRVEFRGATVTSDAGLLLPRLTSTLFQQILGRIERLAWHPT
jgi:hypothetical protein